MSAYVNIGLSAGILIVFFVVIGVGYVYLNEGRMNFIKLNATVYQFIDNWDKRQAQDNIRFNATLKGLAETYNLIVDNQGLIINSSNNTNTLVKFLADNFGAQSGYLERENFQYARANKTFDMITALYENQTR